MAFYAFAIIIVIIGFDMVYKPCHLF